MNGDVVKIMDPVRKVTFVVNMVGVVRAVITVV